MRKPTGFAIQLNMRFEREESEDDTFFFFYITESMALPGGAGLRVNIKPSF